MSQLSRPYQIALGALLVLAIAWFTVLKPSDDAGAVVPLPGETTAAAPTLPGQKGLTKAVEKAQGAVATSSNSADATQAAAALASGDVVSKSGGAAAAAPTTPVPSGVTGATGPSGATGAAAAAVKGEDPSAPILRDVARDKVAVVLFYSDAASDDQAVRRALVAADRHRGRVAVHFAPIARVADYEAITEGIDVTQSPTLLVIGKQNRAREIVGFTDTRGIDQLVSDVGGPGFVPRRFKGYRGKIENLCAVADASLIGNLLNGPDVVERLGIARSDYVDALRSARALEAPRRYFAFQRAFEKDLAFVVKELDAAIAAAKDGTPLQSVISKFAARESVVVTKEQKAARKAGLKGC